MSQPAIPEVASLPAKTTWTGWFHHPPRSGRRSGVIEVMVGAVESYLTAACPLAALPATSRQPPGTSAAGSSGPAYDTLSQLAMPDVASLPPKSIVTAWFHQPP